MARRCAAGARKKNEAVAHPLDELGRRKHPHARRRQLDRQRQSIQQPYDLGHRSAVVLAEDEIRPLRPRTGGAKVDRFSLHRQRLEGEDRLTREVQSLAAGDDERRIGGPVEPPAERGGRAREDLLEIVEDPEAAAATCDRVTELDHRIFVAQRDRERHRDRPDEPLEAPGFAQVAKVRAARPVTEPRPAVPPDEAGLAGPARTEDGEQPGSGVEPLRETVQLRAPADERVALRGQVLANLADGTPKVAGPHHAVSLVGVLGRRERRLAAHTQLEDFERLQNAL